jgi:hypothetical protein
MWPPYKAFFNPLSISKLNFLHQRDSHKTPKFFSHTKHPDRIWSPPSPIFKRMGWGRFLLRSKAAGVKLFGHLQRVSISRMCLAIPPLLHVFVTCTGDKLSFVLWTAQSVHIKEKPRFSLFREIINIQRKNLKKRSNAEFLHIIASGRDSSH